MLERAWAAPCAAAGGICGAAPLQPVADPVRRRHQLLTGRLIASCISAWARLHTALLQVAFVEQPHFSLSLTLFGGDISILPGLEAYLQNFVRDQLLRCVHQGVGSA